MQKVSVKNVMGGAMLCLFVLAACQKKKIFRKDKDVPLDVRVEQIKQNYENDAHAQQLGLKPKWGEAKLMRNMDNDFQIPLDEKTMLMPIEQGQLGFLYQRKLSSEDPDYLREVQLLYNAQGFLELAIQTRPDGVTYYELKPEAKAYGFHHLNSKELKYNDWDAFDFTDFNYLKPQEVERVIREGFQIQGRCGPGQSQPTEPNTSGLSPNAEYKALCNFYSVTLYNYYKNCGLLIMFNMVYTTIMNYYCNNIPPPEAVPCKGDPLKKMEIVPSRLKPLNIKGGRYGIGNRGEKDGKPKNHKGTDLKANIGDVFVAMYEGKVTEATFIPKDPKKEKCYIDPQDGFCKGDFGNYMRIESTVNGKQIKVLYAHLSKMYYKAGEQITTGQALGTTGKTGNASDDKIIPHLHVEVQENINGTWIKVDPEKYLTSKFDAAGSQDPNTGNCKQ